MCVCVCVCVCVRTYACKGSKYGEGSSGKWKAHNSEWKLQSSAFKWEYFTIDQQCASPSHRPSNINTKGLEQKNLIRISILKF